jgi:hypothetical protein
MNAIDHHPRRQVTGRSEAKRRTRWGDTPMWRALFLAIGITCCILGAECLVVQKAVFVQEVDAAEASWYGLQQPPRRDAFEPPEWAPWSLLTAGAVIVLYSITFGSGPES